MITIDNTFLTSVGITGVTSSTVSNQKDWFYDLEMVNGETVYNKRDFFINSPVDGTYYDNQLDWYKAIGTFHSEPIYNEASYMNNVSFNGVVSVGNMYDYYKGIKAAFSV